MATTKTNGNEATPLVQQSVTAANAEDYVIATSTGGTSPEPTVHVLMHSSNPDDANKAITFKNRVLALVVFQYTSVLIVASPFALIPAFQDIVHPHFHTLYITFFVIMVLSILLAITKGAMYPYSRIIVVTLTLSVAVELGLTFEEKSWGTYGMVAVGQATASFCILLALFQFEGGSSTPFTFSADTLLCAGLAGIWTVILHEVGLRWSIACAVSLGGFVYCMLALLQFNTLCNLVAPSEYVFATLFILFPQAVWCLSKVTKRHVAVAPTSSRAGNGGGGRGGGSGVV